MMRKLIKSLCLIIAVCCKLSAIAQVKAELIYPVVPMPDDCSFVFDDTSRIRVISKEDFLLLDRLWFTTDFCYEQTKDTVFFKEFTVVFIDIFGDAYSYMPVADGHLNNEYLSSLNDSRNAVKSYTKVHFEGIRHEVDGALFQVKNFTLVIDSFVSAKFDSCWSQLAVGETLSQNITREKLIALIDTSLGYNNCTKQQNWPDSVSNAEVVIAPAYNGQINVFLPRFSLKNKTDIEKLKASILDLNQRDIVEFKPITYTKDGEIYKSNRIRFVIEDSTLLKRNHMLEYLDSIISAIYNPMKNENDTIFCLQEDYSKIASFKLITMPDVGNPSMASSNGNCFTSTMIKMIRDLKIGDRVILENIKMPFDYDNKHYHFVGPVVTIVR